MFNDRGRLGDAPYGGVEQDYVLEYIWAVPNGAPASGGQQGRGPQSSGQQSGGQQSLHGAHSHGQQDLEAGYQQARQSLNHLHEQAQRRVQQARSPEEAQHYLATFHQQAQQHLHAHHLRAQQQLHALHTHAHQQAQGQPEARELSDDDIQRLVNDALDHHPMTSNADIHAAVKNHEVNLTGTARNPQVKRIADALAWNCSGVINVNNNIEIQRRGQQAQGQQSGQTAASASGA